MARPSKALKIAQITWISESYGLPIPQDMDKMKMVELKLILQNIYKSLPTLSHKEPA